jgi:hypothetical protein
MLAYEHDLGSPTALFFVVIYEYNPYLHIEFLMTRGAKFAKYITLI